MKALLTIFGLWTGGAVVGTVFALAFDALAGSPAPETSPLPKPRPSAIYLDSQ